jgi:hypothetical protein
MPKPKPKKIPATQGKVKDYAVGYKKPPVHSRWKKGQSGNPKGYKTPQNVIELNALLDDIFAELVTDASGAQMEKLRVALNRLLLGKNPQGVIHLLERRYGKVPQTINLETGKTITVDIGDEDSDSE